MGGTAHQDARIRNERIKVGEDIRIPFIGLDRPTVSTFKWETSNRQ